jgi:hypothetical protein
MKLAEKIEEALWEDLLDRAGFEEFLDDIDPDVVVKWRGERVRIVERAIEDDMLKQEMERGVVTAEEIRDHLQPKIAGATRLKVCAECGNKLMSCTCGRTK